MNVRQRTGAPWSPMRAAAAVSVVSSALGATMFALAVVSLPGQRADAAGFALLAAPGSEAAGVARLLRALIPMLVACWLGVCVVAAVRRRETGRALVAAGLPLVVLVLASVLRDAVLPRPDLGAGGYLHNTFPSAHTATVAAACVAVAMLLRSPTRPGPAVALAGTVALAAWSNVLSLAHRPSDVLGALLLVGVVAPWVTLVAPRRASGRVQAVPDSTNRK